MPAMFEGGVAQLPPLSVSERDRRYALLRQQLAERGIDAVIMGGTNLFYLTNGVPNETYGLLTTEETPFVVTLRSRLWEIDPRTVLDAQDWVTELRSGRDAETLIERLKELHVDKGTIGLTDTKIPYLGLPTAVHTQIVEELPEATIVDVSDVFANVRAIKSEEEVALIERANVVFDAAIERVHEVARPGMLGTQVLQEGIKAMWEAGGDLHSSFFLHFGPIPFQNSIAGELCLQQRIRKGDIGTMTGHSHFRGYAGHSDQVLSFGPPSQLHRDMFDATLYVRDAVLRHVKPGATQDDLDHAYEQACEETSFRAWPHRQIHQYGIDVPENAGSQWQVRGKPREGFTGVERAYRERNYLLAPGMIYSISPVLKAPNSDDTILGGTSLVVTDTGYRDLGDRKVELLVVEC